MPIGQSVDLDSLSATIVAGEGAAGTPAGGVVSIQGVTNGTVVPVSGVITQSFTDVVPAPQNITAFDTVTTSLVGANGQVFYAGTPTTNSAATFTLASISTVQVQASLLGVGGTMVVEISMDGSFWFRPNVYQISTQSYSNGFTAPFMAIVNTSGCSFMRVRGTVSWSGTATILVHETLNQRPITIADALPQGANVIGGVTQSGTWASTVTQATGTNLHAVIDSGTVIATQATGTNLHTVVDSGTIAATQSGTWNVNSNTNDGLGNDINSQNSQLLTADIINTSSQYRAQSVTTSAAQALGAASALTNRKFIQITPTNGTIYYGTSNAVTTATGSPLFSNQTLTVAFGTIVQLWVIAATTVDTRVLEGS